MRARTLSAVLLGFALCACGPAKPSKVPCDDGDTAAKADLATLTAACWAQLDACSTQACVDEAQAGCNRQVEARCVDAP